jgi:RNA 2',3'-cyclic 3'-phosphodiesterase
MRAFFALYPDAEALQKMESIIEDLRSHPFKIKWEKPAHIHITMKFLADVQKQDLERIIADVKEEIEEIPEISFPISILSAFPNTRKPRIIWLGGAKAPDSLPKIHHLLNQAGQAAGLEAEKKSFTPHFTIGRVKDFNVNPDLKNTIESCSFQSFTTVFRELRLMESTLTPQGAIHKEIDRLTFR